VAAFSFNEFYQRNRRVVIWVILFLLLWALRDFFAVVFLTFVLAIIAAPLAEIGMRRLKLPHWASVTLVYVIFLGVLSSFVAFVVPSVVAQLNRTIQNLPSTEATVIETKNRLVQNYPALREPINGFMRSALADDRLEIVDLELDYERQRLGLTEAQLAAAAESAAVRSDWRAR
jgi:predicted PurR-regulated permease PerM